MPDTESISLDRYYRLPWNLADNAITWLEPTTKCNIHCDGCYRDKDPEGHRPLENVIRDLECVKKLRKTDGISIAGGEPLLYPRILDLVRYIAEQGWKPVIITNGTLLESKLIDQLRRAGLAAFTVHIDSHQHRPHWDGKSEQELNELRAHYAQLIHSAGRGRIGCSLNATIYPDTVKDIPALTQWAQENIHIVQTMVYILFRQARFDACFDYSAGGRQLQQTDADRLVYSLEGQSEQRDVMAGEVLAKIKEVCPRYEPCAFLNSNQDAGVPKWLLAMRVGRKGKILGYMDARFAEFNQVMHHLLFGSYLAYPRPVLTRNTQFLLPFAPLNRGLRKLLWRWLADPAGWLRSASLQSILILQPPDVLADGRQAMCDGCPDSMYHDGKLIWKCRLDELQKFGGFVQINRRAEAKTGAGAVVGECVN